MSELQSSSSIDDRRDFLKKLVSVGALAVTGLHGCGKGVAGKQIARPNDSGVRDSVLYNQSLSNDTQREIKMSVEGLKAFISPTTGLPVSHVGTKQMVDWAFTYDSAVASTCII